MMKLWINMAGVKRVLGKQQVLNLIQNDVLKRTVLDLASNGDSETGKKLREYIKLEKEKEPPPVWMTTPSGYGC